MLCLFGFLIAAAASSFGGTDSSLLRQLAFGRWPPSASMGVMKLTHREPADSGDRNSPLALGAQPGKSASDEFWGHSVKADADRSGVWGLAGAFALVRFLTSPAFRVVGAYDAVTFIGRSGVASGWFAIAASYLPARRAVACRSDHRAALRVKFTKKTS